MLSIIPSVDGNRVFCGHFQKVICTVLKTKGKQEHRQMSLGCSESLPVFVGIEPLYCKDQLFRQIDRKRPFSDFTEGFVDGIIPFWDIRGEKVLGEGGPSDHPPVRMGVKSKWCQYLYLTQQCPSVKPMFLLIVRKQFQCIIHKYSMYVNTSLMFPSNPPGDVPGSPGRYDWLQNKREEYHHSDIFE